MEKDIIYKLREIKYRRLVHQIKKDITEFIYRFNDETIQEFLQKKYPEIKVDMDYDKSDVWNINVTIPRPVTMINVKFTVTTNSIGGL